MEELVYIINICQKSDKKFVKDDNNHDGAGGHFLEDVLGISHNSNNKPDLYGWELKNFSKKQKKMSFVDKTADWYKYPNIDEHCKLFGLLKINKISWSGSCCPSYYEEWSTAGQIIRVNNKDFEIYYNYEKDKRPNKNNIIYNEALKNGDIIIVRWSHKSMNNAIDNKFNVNGIIAININNLQDIHVYNPFNYNYFLEAFKKKEIIFDSGMKIGNSRRYSTWRTSNNNFLKSLEFTKELKEYISTKNSVLEEYMTKLSINKL